MQTTTEAIFSFASKAIRMTHEILLSSDNLTKARWQTPRAQAQPCLSVPEIRKVEDHAFKLVDSWLLMQAAGLRSARKILDLLQHQPHGPARCVVLAGPGNNGGDALVVASELAKHAIEVHLVDFGQPDQGSPDRQKAVERCKETGMHFTQPAQMVLRQASVVVDGLLGIGCSRAPEGAMLECIEAINTFKTMGHLPDGKPALTVVSLDCPSGLDGSSGLCPGQAIFADLTLTYIALKTGLLCNQGRDHAGEILVEPLGCEALLTQYGKLMTRTDQEHMHRLPQRDHQHHKGSFGSLAVIGGETGMTGAAVMAARSAISLGAGRVALTLLDEHPVLDWLYPELMNKDLQTNLTFADCLVVGPGLGQSLQAKAQLAQVLNELGARPLVFDADALNLLASDETLRNLFTGQLGNQSAIRCVLTPHPQEAARLLGESTDWVKANRLACAQKLANTFRSTVVLKGSGTLITDPDRSLINCTGGPALATAGSGDVLSGAIGALLAQGVPAFHAAATAVWLHGYSVEANGYHCEPLAVSHATEITHRMKTLFNHMLYKRTACHR